LNAVPGCFGVFLVKNVKRRQADIGNFFFTERDLVTRCKARRPRLILRRRNRRGCAAHQRERQSGGA
jgi:hypothetical protein